MRYYRATPANQHHDSSSCSFCGHVFRCVNRKDSYYKNARTGASVSFHIHDVTELSRDEVVVEKLRGNIQGW